MSVLNVAKKMRKIYWLGALIVALGVSIKVMAIYGSRYVGKPQTIGASRLTVGTRTGKRVDWRTLISLKRRTLVVFMTVWCKACHKKQSLLTSWAERRKSTTKVVLVVSGSSQHEVITVARRRRLSSIFSVAIDERGKVANHYKVSMTPTYILFGPAGRIERRVFSLDRL